MKTNKNNSKLLVSIIFFFTSLVVLATFFGTTWVLVVDAFHPFEKPINLYSHLGKGTFLYFVLVSITPAMIATSLLVYTYHKSPAGLEFSLNKWASVIFLFCVDLCILLIFGCGEKIFISAVAILVLLFAGLTAVNFYNLKNAPRELQ